MNAKSVVKPIQAIGLSEAIQLKHGLGKAKLKNVYDTVKVVIFKIHHQKRNNIALTKVSHVLAFFVFRPKKSDPPGRGATKDTTTTSLHKDHLCISVV